ncbi:hypothetical protein PAPHI01_2327 [Pancytospora philotis]|nr:hypothetical protein PAPHI01_2327 [Pancytospora philotis]
MGVLLVISMFAQLSCASRWMDDLAATISNPFYSGTRPSKRAAGSQHAADSGSRESGKMTAAQPEWSHEFLERLDTMLRSTYNEVERIRDDGTAAATTVPATSFKHSGDSGLEGDQVDNDLVFKWCQVCRIKSDNRTVFNVIFLTDHNSIAKCYADLQRAEGAELADGTSVAAAISELLSTWASVVKTPLASDSEQGSSSRADTPECAMSPSIEFRVMRLHEQCSTLCGLACFDPCYCAKLNNSTAQVWIEARNKISHPWVSRSIEEKRSILASECDRLLSKLKIEIKKVTDLNNEISKRRRNVERVTGTN